MTSHWFSRRVWGAWVAVAAVGAAALAARWLDPLRPAVLDRLRGAEFHVTNPGDAGLGTLRAAILAADNSNSRIRIVIDVPRIVVTTPLPPLVNPRGVIIESAREPSSIEAAPGVVRLLDIAAPGAVISNLRIAGAQQEAILVRSDDARISRISVERCGTGIALAPGADALVVQNSSFDANDVGIRLFAAPRHVTVSNNRFRHHRTAAVWAVAADHPPDGAFGLSVRDNRSDDDGQALIVMNIDARIERNTVAGARSAALLVSGSSTIVRANRIRSGIGFGISADRLTRGVIADNEIDHNCAGGIIVRDAVNTDVTSNRIYANGYGIVMVMGGSTSPNTVADNLVVRQVEDGLYVIGSSPLVRRNRVLDNQRAGLRLAALRTGADRLVAAEPLLNANVVSGNQHDTVVDEYRSRPAAVAAQVSADCAWRAGGESR